MTLYEDVVGQERVVAQLRAAARAPVHAYLLVGPPGSGKRAASVSFAASLLCERGGCGECDVCRRVLAGVHPDVVTVEREGASISAEQAREIVRLAARTPNEAARKVLILVDFHLVQQQAPILLKTVEEPPASAVFVILAEHVPNELVTIASRCVRLDFRPLSRAEIADALVVGGIDAGLAEEVAGAAGGRLDRARLLAEDPAFASRRDTWRSVPARLDGTGATVATIVAELVDVLATASVAPLEQRHASERAALETRIERYGERGAGRRTLDERHKRELRRLRLDELRFGLAAIEGVYRDALAAGATDAALCIDAVRVLHDAVEALIRNPNEQLLLQATLLRLPSLSGAVPYSAATPG